ncbi:hypothetical protein [Leptolyngbya sp. O-77]|uniref:hypothetical protein n=1 Tax=Leptolyngbya sp. O-77 TaxID=1080068 RepID=UPI00074D4056|nr:hypothetical protein [Leptolyngbya sp. O-77]BAU45030.1 hypothetical protein O77CONTIG1_04878 [Leptolyngbya sp. O-77]
MTIRGFRRKRRATLPTAEQLLNLGQNLSQGLSMEAIKPHTAQPKSSCEEWTTERLIQHSQSLKNIWM